MENNQLLPFERNRYYVGKLLTSADFQAEQTYGNHKRRFLNGMMFGSGVLCGLGVYSLDDLSIMVDSGVALDGNGNEIAVENAVVKKLSAIEGFEGLETERAVLCLRHTEESVHPVYAVGGQEKGESYECNRIREGWQLFLQDAETMEQLDQPQPDFLSVGTLYADEDYEITCTIPAVSGCGSGVRMDVTVTRLRDGAAPITLKSVIQTPAFQCRGQGHELYVELLDVSPERSVTKSYWLTAQSQPASDSVLLASAESIRVQVGEDNRTAEENFLLTAVVEKLETEALVDRAVASISLEMHGMSGQNGFVPLAEVALQRTRNAYLIESISEIGTKRYIRSVASTAQRGQLMEWFQGDNTVVQTVAETVQAPVQMENAVKNLYATGTCELALGASGGAVIFSDEIIHGLGTGTIYVSVGPEYLTDDVKVGTSARNTIYGDAGLFAGEDEAIIPADLAVKVMADRGSFVVAARLREPTTQAVMTLRWVAVAMPGATETKIQRMAGKSIAAVQPTVVIATRANHYFNVRFKNMEPTTLTYELTEKDSGQITSDGIYTAPGREGVFEIRISCAEMPLISTYAYAVVKKKNVQDDGEED